MSYTLEQFSADCRRILTREPGPAGREKVRGKLAQLLAEEDFIAAHCGPDAPVGRHTLYDDAALGFQVLAHIMKNDHDGRPHDHGSSWAIYGQAVKHTDMTVWKRLDDASVDGKADIERDRQFRLEPGDVGIFNEATIHSISYPGGGRFVRVTGTDLDRIKRSRFDADAGTTVFEMSISGGATS